MPRKKKEVVSDDDLVLAGHEAGHAVFMWHHPELPGVESITLMEDADSLGHTKSSEDKRRFNVERYFRAEVASDFAGRVAEQLLFDEVSDLGDEDLETATKNIKSMVMEHGYGKRVGLLHLKNEPTADPLLSLFMQDMHDISVECARLAMTALEERYDTLALLTRTLVQERTLHRPRLEELLGERPKRRIRTINPFPAR